MDALAEMGGGSQLLMATFQILSVKFRYFCANDYNISMLPAHYWCIICITTPINKFLPAAARTVQSKCMQKQLHFKLLTLKLN